MASETVTLNKKLIESVFRSLVEERDELHALATVVSDRFKGVDDFIGGKLANLLEDKLSDMDAINQARSLLKVESSAVVEREVSHG